MLSSAHDSPASAMDELTAPLGQTRVPRRRLTLPRALAVLVGISLIGTGAWVALAKNPFRSKTAAATPAAPPAPAAQPLHANAPAVQPPPEPDRTSTVQAPPEESGRRTITIIDGITGKRQDVVIGSPEPAPSAAPGKRAR
jgi:uncharacterized protein